MALITDQVKLNPKATASAPSGTEGAMYYDSDKDALMQYGTSWKKVSAATATGGTETTISGYKIHTFTASGTFAVSGGALDTEVLVIGGGGGGGRAGGGGAGGLIQIMTGIGNVNTIGLLSLSGDNSITIGIGGIGDSRDVVGSKTNGGDTILSGSTVLTAKGGGYGGWSPVPGTAGGSGGGGGFNATTTAPASNQATGFGSYTGIGFGNAGGAGSGGSGSNAGGGGGGSGGAGAAGSGTNVPDGGLGLQININGTNTWYAGGGSAAGHSGVEQYSVASTQGSGYNTDDRDDTTLVAPITYGSGGAAIHDTYATYAKQEGMEGVVIIRYAV
jgi:hypothetical protein